MDDWIGLRAGSMMAKPEIYTPAGSRSPVILGIRSHFTDRAVEDCALQTSLFKTRGKSFTYRNFVMILLIRVET
jgi:hypothetical protein